ncbi:hypothetical protein [Flavobacterium crocinum]|uniref:hypothetical protein n=1 Tax=Flavobacterium crocinum TaxID=2183896 RepID=UPI00142DC4C0|nr:hypothetical protein [Flavobacterium crocinum]
MKDLKGIKPFFFLTEMMFSNIFFLKLKKHPIYCNIFSEQRQNIELNYGSL